MVTEKTKIEGVQNIYKTFEKMGFGKVGFGPDFEEKYKDFTWLLIPHPAAEVRLFAIPPEKDIKTVPWESWYFLDGKPIHRGHCAQKHDDSWNEWTLQEPSPECPDEIVGITWYWYEEETITPLLLLK